MSEPLYYQQMMDFSVKHPREKFYQLYTERGLFGFFYVGFDGEGSDVSTLIWQGTLKNSLDWEAFVSLPSHIDPRWVQNIPFSAFDTRIVTFFIEARDLEEYNLNDPAYYNEYIRTVQNADMISFARYDIHKVSEPVTIAYSFTAENPRWSSTNGSELTILLPKTQPWTTSLMEWVVERHMEVTEVDPRDVVDTLSLIQHS